MRWHHRVYVALRGWFGSAALDSELDQELQFHFDRQLQANLDAGMTPEQARRSAALTLGNPDPIREASRDHRSGAWLRQFGRDLSYGVRLLRKSIGFSASAIAIVALGIGSVTAIFSVVYGVGLRPLPFPEPGRLVQIWGRSPSYARDGVSAADRRDWVAETSAFEAVALYNNLANFNLTDGEGEPERLLGARLSANTLRVLGVSPRLGRGFVDGEDDIGHERVVLLSDALWRRRFAADPAVVGRSIGLSGIPHEVIGVMGADFVYPERPHDLWVPLTVNPKELTREVPPFGLRSIARLKAGVSTTDAQSQLEVIAARLAERYPMNKGVGVEIVGLQSDLIATVRTSLYVMFAAVASLLLVAALNLAGLLSARSAARSRELAVRLALGASRQRIVLQTVAETIPILAAGGILGVAAAFLAVRWFTPLAPAGLPRVESIAIDGTVLVVSFLVLAGSGALASVLPAMQAWRTEIGLATREGARGSTGAPRHGRLRQSLVVAQIALSLPLIIGAVLLGRSFSTLLAIDPGFRSENLVSLHLAIARSTYRSDERIAQYETEIMTRVRQVPGVVSASFVNRLPLSGNRQNAWVEFDDQAPEPRLYGSRVVTGEYFSTLGIPLIDGRTFGAVDSGSSPPVAIVDDRVARQRWPGQSAIGKRLRDPARGDRAASSWVEIVGVVGHVQHDGLDLESAGEIYWDYRQRTQDRAVVVARVTTDPTSTMALIMGRIRELDPEQPFYDVRTLDDVLARSVSERWLGTTLAASFASMALFLCAIGVYGVIAFGVTRQHQEFGINLALGATRRGITRSVLSRGLLLATIGAVAGLILAIALTRTLSSLLFGVAPNDFVSFGASTTVVLAVAALASYLPARRAAAVDPASTLRAE